MIPSKQLIKHWTPGKELKSIGQENAREDLQEHRDWQKDKWPYYHILMSTFQNLMKFILNTTKWEGKSEIQSSKETEQCNK